MKIIKLYDKEIKLIKYSKNSRYLLFGDNLGYLYCYDIKNSFKIIYYQKVHYGSISEIFTIDDD